MEGYIYYLLPVALILNSYTYRFQRIVKSICLSLLHREDRQFCHLVAPPFIKVLVSINPILWIALIVLIYQAFGWIFALIFLFYFLVGTRILDIFLPLPTRRQCARLIEKHLRKKLRQSEQARNEERLIFWQKMLKQVQETARALERGENRNIGL